MSVIKVPNIKFHENLFSGTQAVTYSWADRHSKSKEFYFWYECYTTESHPNVGILFISYYNSIIGDA
jgi:hypothetical protein